MAATLLKAILHSPLSATLVPNKRHSKQNVGDAPLASNLTFSSVLPDSDILFSTDSSSKCSRIVMSNRFHNPNPSYDSSSNIKFQRNATKKCNKQFHNSTNHQFISTHANVNSCRPRSIFKVNALPENSLQEIDNRPDSASGDAPISVCDEPISEKARENENSPSHPSTETSTAEISNETENAINQPGQSSIKKPKPMSSLNSYFDKLSSNGEQTSSSTQTTSDNANLPITNNQDNSVEVNFSNSNQSLRTTDSTQSGTNPTEKITGNSSKASKALKLLDTYFDKINPKPPTPPASPPPEIKEEKKPTSIKLEDIPKKETIYISDDIDAEKLKEIIKKSLLEEFKNDGDPNYTVVFETNEFETWINTKLMNKSTFAINTILAINIAVFLFELASPEAMPGYLVTSLPSLYGAKVNALILQGDWWRLITPMFLHSGFFHVALGSLALFSIGYSIEIAFGSIGLLGTYFVGGLFGNLLSFVQTPDITIGGTGPVYALIGAWIVYLLRNREALGKDYADFEIRKFVFLGAFNIFLGNELPIDDWTHIGGALGGAFYALFVAPKLVGQLSSEKDKNTSSAKLSSPSDSKIGFLSEEPDTKQQFWIFALNIAIYLVLYDIATMIVQGTLPENFFDLF